MYVKKSWRIEFADQTHILEYNAVYGYKLWLNTLRFVLLWETYEMCRVLTSPDSQIRLCVRQFSFQSCSKLFYNFYQPQITILIQQLSCRRASGWWLQQMHHLTYRQTDRQTDRQCGHMLMCVCLCVSSRCISWQTDIQTDRQTDIQTVQVHANVCV